MIHRSIIKNPFKFFAFHSEDSKSFISDERRSHGGIRLREFFDEQLHHLHQLFESMHEHRLEHERQKREDKEIVEDFVDHANRKMRAVHGYSSKLRVHVRALYSYVLDIAEQIPPPVDFSDKSFGSDPLINALFASTREIDKVLETDAEVNAFCNKRSKYDTPVMYALLTAVKTEKRVLGIAMQGDMLVRDVPQQAVNFSSYRIHAPCETSNALSTALKDYLFGQLVSLVKQEMLSRMPPPPKKPSEDSYEARIKSPVNPDVYLDQLIEYISEPSKLLSVKKIHFKLSKLGIKLEGDDDGQRVNEFDIHELTWSNNTKNILLQIAHPRSEV